MSIYKVINDHRNSRDDMEYIIEYATKKPYTVWDTDVGTVGCRKEAILQDMVAIKRHTIKTMASIMSTPFFQ